MRNPFRRAIAAPPAPPPPLPETTAAAMQVVVNAPLINASDDDSLKAAAYRADAIAREIEQRLAEAREAHPDQDKMIAEAMAHAWRLVASSKWTREHVASLEARLLGR
jgi:hypothetical protein